MRLQAQARRKAHSATFRGAATQDRDNSGNSFSAHDRTTMSLNGKGGQRLGMESAAADSVNDVQSVFEKQQNTRGADDSNQIKRSPAVKGGYLFARADSCLEVREAHTKHALRQNQPKENITEAQIDTTTIHHFLEMTSSRSELCKRSNERDVASMKVLMRSLSARIGTHARVPWAIWAQGNCD